MLFEKDCGFMGYCFECIGNSSSYVIYSVGGLRRALLSIDYIVNWKGSFLFVRLYTI